MTVRRATVRLQLHGGFDFDAAARIVPLLARIGYSHVYTSPVLQAAHGSTHGYDVVDPTRVNDELGGDEGLARFRAALVETGMRWLLDIVPNHMEISDPRNAWWWDVLENGPSSPFASFFDIDWHPPEPKLAGVVLMPILGDHRGHILERREIAIERHGGFFVVRYFDHALPLAPRTLDVILRAASADTALDDDARDFLALMADAHTALLDDSVAGVDRAQLARRHRDKRVLRRLLARNLDDEERTAKAVDASIARINDDPKALDALLERQSYRLAWWRTSEQEIDYRRFFDIDHLVALRMEDEAVFKETHALVVQWAKDGVIDGVRVDHVDGLADPKSYLERLRAQMPSSWIVVEKILARDEELRADWPIAGTTGYDFLAMLDGAFVDPAGVGPLARLASQLTGDDRAFADVAAEKKAFVLSDVLASDAKRVTALIARVCDEDRMMRDTTRHDLHTAVCALAAAFPVYRSYVVVDASDDDRAAFTRAVAEARARNPNVDGELLEWLARFLSGGHVDETVGSILSNAKPILSIAQEARARFQQLTAPAMAKGVEDTAFYSFHHLDSACEVGGSPAVLAVDVAALHRHNERAQERWPERLCTTSTHDTKRSEDARARIAVLSELAPEWSGVVDRLLFLGGRHKARHGNTDAPAVVDRAAEYGLFQTLVGTWPTSLGPASPASASTAPGADASLAVVGRGPTELSGAPGELSGAPGELSGAPGELSGTPGELSGAPGELSGTPGELSGAPGELSGAHASLTAAPVATTVGRRPPESSLGERPTTANDAPPSIAPAPVAPTVESRAPESSLAQRPTAEYVERVLAFVQKSAREAKVMTSWTRPNEAYERALAEYTRGVIEDDDVRRVLEPLLAKLVPAARIASIAKTLIKLASPGVPDVYQGCDLWDESLVDPDNRRPVDWAARERALDEAPLWDSGAVKLHVIRAALAVRARRPELFGVDAKLARYRALDVRGVESDRCVAFSRGPDDDVVLAVPRLCAHLVRGFALDVERLGDTALVLPRARYVDALTGAVFDVSGRIELRDLWRRFPAALLERK